MSSSALRLPSSPLPPLPVTPTAEVWAEMSPAARERFIAEAGAALMAHQEAMGEGSPHGRAKARAWRLLDDFFFRSHRLAYLNSELPVLYPGEEVFCPDLLVVLGVIDPGEVDTRMCWSVMEEGRGLDLVLEIVHRGDRRKDLVDNVTRFARLGIEEYFVYDRGRQRILGWRQVKYGAREYQAITPLGGRLASKVLGLELTLVDGRLRFLRDGSPVLGDGELLDQANILIDQAVSRSAEIESQLEGEVNARQAAEAARVAAESQVSEAAAARLAAEARASEEAAARLAAESRASEEAAARLAAESRALEAAAARLAAESRASEEAAARQALEARLAALEARLRSEA
jgi:Uma2 family endonuclease